MKKLHPQTAARIEKMVRQNVDPKEIARAMQVSTTYVRKIVRKSC